MKLSSVRRWASTNVVLVCAVLLAAASVIFVPVDAGYLEYFDIHTLASLFFTLSAIAALQGAGFFTWLAGHVIRRFRSLRSLVLALVLVTAGASLLFTNDLALVALLPLAYLVLERTGNLARLPLVFTLQAVAANLGGMLMPFGNPQNLYLFSVFGIPLPEFVLIMAPPFVLSMLLMLPLVLLVPKTPIQSLPHAPTLAARRVGTYVALFAVAIAAAVHLVPLWVGLVVPLALLVIDRRALWRVDYGLLATFVAFFVFAGNLSRIPAVDAFVRSFLTDNVMLWSAAISQVISNVPSAILLSRFTDDYAQLLVGVNVGGVGTLVASLASLIALAAYRRYTNGSFLPFVRWFTVINLGLLVVLVSVLWAWFALGFEPYATWVGPGR